VAEQPFRYGIMGVGNIARQFAEGVAGARRSRVVAVASRSEPRARAFAAEFEAPLAFGSYEAMLDRAELDAVYIALPNTLHKRWTLAALDAGLHVLCEKPLAMTEADGVAMFDAARRAGRLLVEAFMHRTHPLWQAAAEEIEAGAIGRLRLVRSSFCFRIRRTEGNIRYDPALGGGSLMDVGCYCVNLARQLAGADPLAVDATATLHPGGVDEAAAGWMRFPGDVLASFTCGFNIQADNTAFLCGDEGYLELPVPWKPPTRGATLVVTQSRPPKQDLAAADRSAPDSPPRRERVVDAPAPLYGMEADAFAAAALGEAEPFMPEAETLSNLRTLETMRRRMGSID